MDPQVEAVSGSVEDTDEELNCGRAKMILGSTFLTPPGQGTTGLPASHVPVAKTWVTSQAQAQTSGPSLGASQAQGQASRTWPLESADYLSLKPAFDSLGPPRTASLTPPEDSRMALAANSFLQSSSMIGEGSRSE